MQQLLQCLLDVDGLKAIDRAIKNILNYGVTKRLEKICQELDTFAQKMIKEKASINKGNLADSQPEEQQQQRQERNKKRKNTHSLQQELEPKRLRRAPKNIAHEEENEEGAISSAAEQLQISPKTIILTNKPNPRLDLIKKATQSQQTYPQPNPFGATARLLAVYVLKKVHRDSWKLKL